MISTVIAIALYAFAGAILLGYLVNVYMQGQIAVGRNNAVSVNTAVPPLAIWFFTVAGTVALLLF